MQCEYCNEKKDAFGLLSLPCGYLVCSHHIQSAEDNFNCFLCDEHMINRQLCLEITGNRKRMEKMSFVEKEKEILSICDQIEQFKLDPKSFLQKVSDDIINKIDLKREVLKTNLIKSADNYYESILNDVKEKQLNIIDSIKADFNGINTKDIREKLNLDLDKNSTDYQVQIESLVNLRSSYLDEHLKNFHYFKNIEFFQGEEEPQVIMPKLFGSIGSKYSKVNFNANPRPLACSKTLSNQFDFIAKVGSEKILELKNGEIVLTSQSKKSNLIIFNPQNWKSKEINGQHDIKYLFKTDNDEIIIIDSEFHVKIWYNYKCVYTFDIVPQNLLSVELIDKKLIIVNKDYFLTVLNCYNGRILNHIYCDLENYLPGQNRYSFVKCLSNYFIYKHERFDFVIIYNIQTWKYEKEIRKQFIGNISTIEKINKDEYIIGSETGKILILNEDLSTKISKKCHKSSISTFVLCENGLIVSISVDGEIKIWYPK